jgi:Heterokaryon incompatibility protein (HET)
MDAAEKPQQVMLMGTLYRSAALVNIWLGPQRESSDDGMTVLAYLAGDEEISPEPPLLPEGKRITYLRYGRGLREVLSRPWFRRIWVVQEAALAQESSLICGHHSFTWTRGAEAARFIRRIKYASIAPKWRALGEDALNFTPLLELLELAVTNALDRRSPPDLLDLCYDMRHRESTDPRDMIYGMMGLGLAQCRNPLRADYSLSKEQTYEVLLEHIKTCEDHPPI